MKHLYRILFGVVLVSAAAVPAWQVARAYSGGCEPAQIAETLGTLVGQLSPDLPQDEALAVLTEINAELSIALGLCEQAEESAGQQATATPTVTNPGNGTLADPYAFGVAGNSRSGFALQVTGLIRPANVIIQNENMFNDRPGPNQEYVVVDVRVECYAVSDLCETNYLDYSLVGDENVIYETPFVVFDDELEASLFAGGSTTGRLAFLIRADDTNLRLIYRENMFSERMVVYEAEPSLASGIQIVTQSGINVRNSPSTNGAVVASLEPGVPVVAFGRNSAATWLQIANGWVFAELVQTSGDIQSLPVTAQ
jgi:hypothetical protein